MAGNLKGTYRNTVDVKGRMAFPTKLRDSLGGSFIITIGTEHCLWVYSDDEWEIFTDRIKTLTGEDAKIAKLFIANACTVEPDKQGRILVPQHLREYAALERDVTVIGFVNRAEIWDAGRYKEFSESVTDEMLSKALANLSF